MSELLDLIPIAFKTLNDKKNIVRILENIKNKNDMLRDALELEKSTLKQLQKKELKDRRYTERVNTNNKLCTPKQKAKKPN